MKKYILPSLKMTLVMMVVCSLIYPLLIAAAGRLSSGGGEGETVVVHGKMAGYALIGQKFDRDDYFWSRPSAAGYNGAASSGSNKGPSNPDYLKDVAAHIDTFLAHDPGIKRCDIPAELVTYSGSGLDPDLSSEAARIQVKRIAAKRGLAEDRLLDLIDRQTERPLLGILGPSKVNVLKLNAALDELK